MSDPKSKDFFDKFLSGFIQTVGEDSEHFREANEAVVTGRGDDYKAQSRFSKMMAEHPTIATLQDLFEKGDADLRNERKARGMGLSDDNVTRTGQVTGRVAQDIVRDSSRSVWWLLNAPQAVVDVAAEELIRRANPDLKSESVVRDAAGNKVYYDTADPRAAEKAGAVKDGVKQKGYSFGAGESYQTEDGKGGYQREVRRSNVSPGLVNALKGPGALAINVGMGLLHYGGGMEGYTAAIPSEDDPTKTANVLAEIGAKYIVGRTGNLLPYDEFSKVRPDVSQEEYNRYKAFKYDKSMDLDPRDGNVNLLPLGLLKATTDGIHGAEVQFLGRSLPVNETLVPIATALLGTTAGVYGGKKARDAYEQRGTKFGGVVPPVMPDKDLPEGSEAQRAQLERRTVGRALAGGLGGYVTGAIAGNLLEDERRRRNMEENKRDGSL